MKPSTVLIVEDAADLRRVLALSMADLLPGWDVVEADSIASATEAVRSTSVGLAFVDVTLGLDDQAGVKLVRGWRNSKHAFPIIMMSGNRNPDITLFFSAGANDVMLKPWHPREIQPRIARVLATAAAGARTSLESSLSHLPSRFHFAGAEIKEDRVILFESGKAQLSVKEYGILQFLAAGAGSLVLRETLVKHVWGADGNANSNSVMTYFSGLRRLYREHNLDLDETVSTESKVGWRVSATASTPSAN